MARVRALLLVTTAIVWPALARAEPIDVIGYLRAHPAAIRSGFVRIKPTEAHGQSRTGVFARIPETIDVPVTVPPNARLEVGFTLLDKFFGGDALAVSDPTRFVVSLVFPDGREDVLIDQHVDPRARAEDRRWFDLHRDLSRYAGTTATLRFHHEIAGKPDEPGRTFAVWSRPRLYDPVAERTRPNLLFITIDALRADHLGTYGYARPTTPVLDQLAADGVRFAHAFTNAPMTVPSLPQILTSAVFPRPDSPTLLSSLYAGGVVHSKAIVHNPFLGYWLTIQARDGFDSITNSTWKADHIVRAARKWLATYGGDRFALYLHFLDTHTPYATPLPQATVFSDPKYAGRIGAAFGDVAGAREGKYDAADKAQIVALYDGGLQFVDQQIGLLLGELAERGLLDHTLVVVSADHGEELWDHGSFFHGQSLYDELLHVPLLVRLPGRAHAGTVVEPQVRSIDILPTIADVLGGPVFPEFGGRSLLPLIAGQAEDAPREVFSRAANPDFPYRFGLRTPTHKLILNVGPGSEELYDLVADPGEYHDLAADPAAAAVLGSMRAELRRLRLPLAVSGFQVRVVGRGDGPHPIQVTARVTKGWTITNPDRIGPAAGDRLELSQDLRTLTWTATVSGAPAGIRFERALSYDIDTDPGLDIAVQADGRDVPPEAIRIGGAAAPAPGSPLTYKAAPETLFTKATENPPLLATDPPDLVADEHEPVRVYVWRAPDAPPPAAAPTPIDEESRRKLRALGYVQ